MASTQNGRQAMRMSPAEVTSHLREGRRAQVGTINPDGSIHLVPLAYFFWDDKVAVWTDPESRKVRNLRKDPAITCLVETGDAFEEFRAVQLRGRAELIDGLEDNRRAGELLFARSRPDGLNDELRAYAAMLAAQRVTVVVHADAVVSWDHRKLAGVRPDEIGR